MSKDKRKKHTAREIDLRVREEVRQSEKFLMIVRVSDIINTCIRWGVGGTVVVLEINTRPTSFDAERVSL